MARIPSATRGLQCVRQCDATPKGEAKLSGVAITFKYYLCKYVNMKIYVTKIIRRTFDPKIYDIVIGNKIKVCKKLRLPGRPNKPLLLPSQISVDTDFLVGFGIYYGEATVSDLVTNRIEVANTEPMLLCILLNFFRKFGISRKQIKVQIGIYEEDAEFTERDRLIKFWSPKLKIPKKNFKTITVYNKIGSRKRAARYGTVQLKYHSTLMKIFMRKFTTALIGKIQHDKNMCREFVKGLIAAEGNVEVRPESKSLKSVNVACTKNKDEVFKFLEKMCIKPGKYNSRMRAIRIQGIDNFKILLEMNLMTIHHQKYNSFLTSLRRHRYAYKLFPRGDSPKLTPSSDWGL